MLGLLGGYGSDDEGSDSGSDEETVKKPPPPTKLAPTAAVANGDGKKRKVDISKLPCSKVVFDSTSGKDGEAPLKKEAELANARSAAGRSLLASLPAPKVTLGSETSTGGGGGGGSRIDLSGISRPKKKEATLADPAAILRSETAPEIINENDEVPDGLKAHPMFSGGATGDRAKPDGPSEQDLTAIRASGGAKSFRHINAKDMLPDDWQMNAQIEGGPVQKGAKVPMEMSMYDQKGWKGTTHATPSKHQTRKHQINWLANEAMDKEAELLDRNAQGRLTKAQTSMKYGW